MPRSTSLRFAPLVSASCITSSDHHTLAGTAVKNHNNVTSAKSFDINSNQASVAAASNRIFKASGSPRSKFLDIDSLDD